MIKLIALDLDGTLVNDDLKISDPTLKVLHHLIHNTDVRVVVATGRMHPSALPFAEEIGTPEPLISYQGAMIRTMDGQSTCLHHTPIPMDIAEEVVQMLIEEEFNMNLYVSDTMYTNHENPYATRYARISGITPVKSHDLLKSMTAPPSKMMAIDDHRIDYILEKLQTRFKNRLDFCRSRTAFCEIISYETSKWNAIKVLADQWGIQAHEVMAVGDQENDLSMIQGAGMGVAMGQAPDHVKAVANVVTDSIDDDGVLKAIEQYVLVN